MQLTKIHKILVRLRLKKFTPDVINGLVFWWTKDVGIVCNKMFIFPQVEIVKKIILHDTLSVEENELLKAYLLNKWRLLI